MTENDDSISVRGMSEEASFHESIGSVYWERLLSLHPVDVSNRSGAVYHPAQQGFVLPVYNLRYLILPEKRKIHRIGRNDRMTEETLPPFFFLMVLVYLTSAKDIRPTHTWVTEKDLPGGSTFFRGPHHLPVEELVTLYGGDPGAFMEAGQRLGGSEVFYGDKAFALEVFPKIPLAYLLWKGDEEFPPTVHLLFDSTIQSHLSLDIIWCLVSETTRRLAAKK